MSAVYDIISEFYNKKWKDITMSVYPVIEELVLSHIPPNSTILDVCCGTGTIAAKLSELDYVVEGIDISKEMIEHARLNAPKANFTVGDARAFTYDISFDAAISTLDSFNHITSRYDLALIFESVHRVLKSGGIFCFDLRNEDGYKNFWHGQQMVDIDKEAVAAFISLYDPHNRDALMRGTYFTQGYHNWERKEVMIVQKCYLEDEIFNLLDEIGFQNINVSNRREGNYSDVIGRSYYTCIKRGVK